MRRTKRIIRNAAAGIAALTAIAMVTALIVVRTDWFRTYVRQEIILAAEAATGGRVDVGSFYFDLSGMRALAGGFVIHGDEPAGSAPFVSIARVELQIRLFTNLRHPLDITYLGVEHPQANIMILADGRTNVPTPKQRSTSNKSGLEGP